jgi:hypothetical protein
MTQEPREVDTEPDVPVEVQESDETAQEMDEKTGEITEDEDAPAETGETEENEG